MKRTCLRAVLTLLTACPLIAAAADHNDPKTEKVQKEEPKETAKPVDPIAAEARQRELDYLSELRRAVLAELRMSDDQREAVMRHFKDHTEFVETYAPQPPTDAEKEAIRKRRQEVQRELREAVKAGNRKKAQEIGLQLRELQQQQDPLSRATEEFHEKVRGELNEDQKLTFASIVRRLYKYGDPMRERARGFRDMRRVLDQMNLTPTQEDAIRARYREAMAAFGRDGHDPVKAKAITDQLREGILEVLSENQRDAFLKQLETIEKQPEAAPGNRNIPRSLNRSPASGGGNAAPPE